jgi:hypothetical protein
MDLSGGELTALRNLSQKELGEDVDWISIADARALTELGLAERVRSGWRITAEGEAALGAVVEEAAEPTNILKMTTSNGRRSV